MATLNQCSFIGRLGKDPEMNYTPGGKAVTKFSLAVDQGKDQGAMWLNIVGWEQLAERMNLLLSKGKLVFVQGRLAPRKYTDKNGIDRMALEIVATMFQLLEKSDRPAEDATDPLGDVEDHPF